MLMATKSVWLRIFNHILLLAITKSAGLKHLQMVRSHFYSEWDCFPAGATVYITVKMRLGKIYSNLSSDMTLGSEWNTHLS